MEAAESVLFCNQLFDIEFANPEIQNEQEGNGQQQVIECLTGQIGYQGSVTVLGQEVRGKSIRSIRDRGMAHIPEDRMSMGADAKASERS